MIFKEGDDNTKACCAAEVHLLVAVPSVKVNWMVVSADNGALDLSTRLTVALGSSTVYASGSKKTVVMLGAGRKQGIYIKHPPL